MKKLIALCLALVMALGLMAGCGSKDTGDSGNNADATYKFTVANFYAAVNNHGLLTQAWCDEITERTGGRVTFEYYPGASLVSAANSFDSVKNGIVDIAMTATANTPGVFPVMSYLEMPLGYKDGWVGTHVCNDFINNFDLPEFNGIKVLYTHTVSPLVIHSNWKIESADDFKGMIIRTGSEFATAQAQALGGQAYSCQITELYEALTKKMCDGAISGKDALDGFNLNEVVNYVLDDPAWGKLGVVAMFMNESKWNSLPEDVQQIFNEVNEEFAEYQARTWEYEDIVAYQNFKANGGEVIKFSDDVHQALVAKLEPANQEYIASLGISDADLETYTNYINERIEYWNDKTPTEEEITTWANDYLLKLA